MSKEKYSLSAEERESMAKRIGAASPVDLAEAVALLATCGPHMDEDSFQHPETLPKYVRQKCGEVLAAHIVALDRARRPSLRNEVYIIGRVCEYKIDALGRYGF